jgi:hypothetical protein
VTEPEAPVEPTAEMLEERRVRTDKATKRALAALLVLEALIVLLVPRAIARTDTGLDTTKTVLLVVFAVVLVVAGAMLRRSWGIGLGTFLQVLVVLTGVWVAAMYVLGAVFLAIWLYVLNLRHELVGTPGGWRLLVS